MKPTELLSALQAEPFHPFRVHFGSGKAVEIQNPGLVVVSDTGRTAFAYRPGSDGWDLLNLNLIERLEFMGTNGASKSSPRRRPKS